MIWLLACAALNILVSVFRMVILCDHFSLIQTDFFGLQYAIRLALEFVVLKRLAAVTKAKSIMLARGNLSDSIDVATINAPTSHQPDHHGDVEQGHLREDMETRDMLKDNAARVTSVNSTASTSTMAAIGTANVELRGENVGFDRVNRLYLGRSMS